MSRKRKKKEKREIHTVDRYSYLRRKYVDREKIEGRKID